MADNEKGADKAKAEPAKPEGKTEPQKGKEKAKEEKAEKKAFTTTKTDEYGADFRYLVRIVNTDLDGKKPFATALTYVPGVSHRLANVIAKETGINPKERIGKLSDEQLATVVDATEGDEDLAPTRT